MTHRGACGCEENTGDGAGILVAVPDGFLRKAAREAGIGELPPEGEYAVGNIFVPKFENSVPEAKAIVERVCKQRGMKVGHVCSSVCVGCVACARVFVFLGILSFRFGVVWCDMAVHVLCGGLFLIRSRRKRKNAKRKSGRLRQTPRSQDGKTDFSRHSGGSVHDRSQRARHALLRKRTSAETPPLCTDSRGQK